MHRTVKHLLSPRFWRCFNELPKIIQESARRSYQQMKRDPHHPSLQFKTVGQFWSVRIGLHYRALAVERDADLIWFWIGSHAEYDKLVGNG